MRLIQLTSWRLPALALCASSLLLSSCSKTDSPNEQTAAKSIDGQELLLHVPSPDWRDQVIYFLMIDRFNDGDPSNNDQGTGEYDPHKESHWSGGDIQGVIDELDYIRNLGATAVWTTPQVANQWWSNGVNYGGYHGYWATDFSDVDVHYGDMSTYQQLSDALHRKGMYLVQDIVVNHTGNFFNYDGPYNPEDTAENFFLYEQPGSVQPAPVQPPFDKIDRNNPEHAAANIYNWTPNIVDFLDPVQQFTYQLPGLADINTRNPVVIDTFKQTYGDWIRKAGVDAFRIDTVRYVEPEFFHHFMRDPDGILATAKETGRDDFLAFGEVFETSLPFQNDAEQRLVKYIGDDDYPILDSLIGFPLFADLNAVFGQGQPTDQLAYRLKQHMSIYKDPYITPNFIDNHDTVRFLSAGDVEGFKQAYATIFTIPGIPVIYQGSAQTMVETRKAMFKGGFEAERDYFDQTTEMYQFIRRLSDLRKSSKVLTRGDFNMLRDTSTGPGVLAYTRSYQGETLLVMYNTAENTVLVDGMPVNPGNATLEALFMEHLTEVPELSANGELTTALPPRSILVAKINDAVQSSGMSSDASITISSDISGAPLTADTLISGTSSAANSELQLVINANLDRADSVMTDSAGNWSYSLPVRNLGTESNTLVAYLPALNATSAPVAYTALVSEPSVTARVEDPANDETGLTGDYQPLSHAHAKGQTDITGAEALAAGSNMELNLTMRAVTNDWIPANGFDNVAFSIFIDLPGQDGLRLLPELNGEMHADWQWNIGHVAFGWGNSAYGTEGATADHAGHKFSVSPAVSVDVEARTIRFTYKGDYLGVTDWQGARIYVTTWDKAGEGWYRNVSPEGGEWVFTGPSEDAPKILDSVTLTLD